MIAMADTLLTLDEVATMLRCAKSTVKRYIRNGTLAAVKVGGRYRVLLEEVDCYITRNNTKKEDK
jgi:excisionase family DNA binding protein